jgi:hypothetical protein
MREVVLKVITVYMYVALVYGREGECIPLRAWWLFGSSILAPLSVRKPEPANAARPLRNFCDRHFVNCHWRGRFRSLPHGWWCGVFGSRWLFTRLHVALAFGRLLARVFPEFSPLEYILSAYCITTSSVRCVFCASGSCYHNLHCKTKPAFLMF